jgi:hypothetical protein
MNKNTNYIGLAVLLLLSIAVVGGILFSVCSLGMAFYQRSELYRIEAQRKQILLQAEQGWQQQRNAQPNTPQASQYITEQNAERLADYFLAHPSPTPEAVTQVDQSLIPHSVQ